MKTKLTLFVAVLAVALFGMGCASTELGGDPLKDGLVAYYPFENSLADQSGNGLNGSIRGEAKFGEKSNNLSGIYLKPSSYIDVPLKSSLISQLKGFSISLWFKTPRDDGGGQPYILTTREYTIGIGGTQLYVSVKGNDGEAQCTVIGYRDIVGGNKWAQVALVIDQNQGFLRGYLNGSSSFFDGPPSLPNEPIQIDLNKKHVLRMGAQGRYDKHFEGSIDDVRIYNRALSAAEVKALYDLEKPKAK